MIRRWLAAVRGLDAEDEAAAARLREAGSPLSEESTDVPEGGEKSAPPDTKRESAGASGEDVSGEVAEVAAAALVTAAKPAGSPPGSPPDPDAEWADVQIPAELPRSSSAKLSMDVAADASASDAVAARFFRSERSYRKSGDISRDSNISRDDDETFDFRDVLLRSRCLENLVGSFARVPARDDAEAGAFAELVDALVWQGGEPAYEKPAEEEPAEEESSEEKTSVAALLVSGVARAGAALRHPKRAAEVQLGDDALVEMLAACAGSVKRVGAAETLRRREVRLRAAGDANAAAVRALSAEARDPRHARVSASVSHPYEASEKSETSSNREDVSPTTEETKKTNDADAETSSNLSLNFDPSVRLARPTSALAAATRLGVDLARRAHDHAAARATRLAAESELAPTADALARCRASLETLARASSDVAGLSEQSRSALLEAERFREEKLAECVAAETARRDAARVAEERRAEAASRLAVLTLEASRFAEEAERSAAEHRAFEESAEAVRETLERKVRDLRDRAEEYRVESAAIAAARDALRDVARARATALEAAAAAADGDLASARRRYVEAARAHGEGQAGAARLCLARLRFCKKELEETRRKRAEASALGLRGGEDGDSGAARTDLGRNLGVSSADARKPKTTETTGAETTEPSGCLSADLRAAQRSIERAYVEAERGAKAVFAAAEASRREATAIAPAAIAPAAGEEGATRPAPKSPEDSPGVLAVVFGVIDEARAAFAAEAATRPALEIEETEETEETEEPTDEETADETEKEEKASRVSEDVAEDVAEDVSEDVAEDVAANAVSAEDAPTDVISESGGSDASFSRRRTTPTAVSETERSVGRVAPDAPEPEDFFDSRPAEEDALGTNAAETETTTDDVDDWLADD